MSAETLRIGDLARLAGTTARTIRYYEEIGLLPGGGARMAGSHRLYDAGDLERLREVMRLKSLLGVSLDELEELIAAEDARAALRSELSRDDVEPDRRRALLFEAAYCSSASSSWSACGRPTSSDSRPTSRIGSAASTRGGRARRGPPAGDRRVLSPAYAVGATM